VLLDLTAHEVLVDEPDERQAFHPYPDELPDGLTVVAYSLEELFAEKTRALFERTLPRDLYDVVQIVQNHSNNIDFQVARAVFRKKCSHKRIEPPDSAALKAVVLNSEELRAEWENMLAHQLPMLPPIDSILLRLDDVLAWVDSESEEIPSVVVGVPSPIQHLGTLAAGEVVAPPSVTYWGGGAD
jgi:hypothetical protein